MACSGRLAARAFALAFLAGRAEAPLLDEVLSMRN